MGRQVFLVTVDCLRADHVSGAGYPLRTTPVLDAMAAEGVGFPRAYSTAGHTAMSFPGLLLSNYFQNFGRSRAVPPHLTTLAEGFSREGFRTVALNAGNVQLSHFYEYDRGFDEFRDFIDDRGADTEAFEAVMRPDEASLQALLADLQARPETLAMVEELTGLRGEDLVHALAERLQFYPCDASQAVARTIEDLESGPEGDRFYWMHLMDVHEDITVPAGPLCAFGPAEQLLLNLCISTPGGRPVLARDPRPYIGLYDAAVNHVDTSLGVLRRHLKETGRLEDSLICVVADHGQLLFEGGMFGHGFVWLMELLVHVPLVFSGGLADGLRGCDTGRAVSTLDLSPTILDLCGVDAPDSFLGRSLRDETPRPVCGQSFSCDVNNRMSDRSVWRYYLTPFPKPIREWATPLLYGIEDGWQCICSGDGKGVVRPLKSAPQRALPDAEGMKRRLIDYFESVYDVPEQQDVTEMSDGDKEIVAARLHNLGYL